MAPHSKCGEPARAPWVRIPPCPPVSQGVQLREMESGAFFIADRGSVNRGEAHRCYITTDDAVSRDRAPVGDVRDGGIKLGILPSDVGQALLFQIRRRHQNGPVVRYSTPAIASRPLNGSIFIADPAFPFKETLPYSRNQRCGTYRQSARV